MLTTYSGYGCRNRFIDSPTSIGAASNLGIHSPRSKSFSKTSTKLKTLSGISSYADPACIARMKRLKNKKINGIPKMDLNKRKPADYTELAYREAISKLKYLLADSYAPTIMFGTKPQSARSIYKTSNSRIRESEEDTDDHSMISDSFRRKEFSKNVVSNTYSPLSKAIYPTKAYSNIAFSRADLQSVPPELTSYIERQEDYIEQLERESQYCRDELMNLLSKVREVVAENDALHNKNQTVLSKCTLQDHKECIEVSQVCHKQDTNNGMDNFETKREKPLEGPSIMFESRISELEAQLTQAKLELRKTQEENQANLKRLSNYSNENNPELKAELDKALRAKCEVEIKLEELQKLLSTSRNKESEAAQKARQSIDDRQQIEFERNQSEIEIRRLKDELERQHEKLREAAQEANRRINEERQQIERRYNQQIEQLSADIASHWEIANKAQLECEKQRREINELRRELSQKQTATDNLKKELQNKISTLQSDLNQTLSEKDAIEQEVLTGKLAAERNERQARQEQSRLQTEINSYKQRLERADADLVHCRRENLRLSEHIASLEKEISMSKITCPEDNRSQATPILENEKELTSMIMDMETKHEGVVERDVTTNVGQTASPSNKKRTVKVDLKVKVIPKKKSDSSKVSLSAQKEMAELQNNIEHLSNKIQGTFLSHEGESSMKTNDETSAIFHYNTAMDPVASLHTNGLTIGENAQAPQMIQQGYNIAINQQLADERPGMYSDTSQRNDQSQNLYDLSGNQTITTEDNSVSNMMETEMYQQGDDRNNEGYIPNDPNMDVYMAEQAYDQYSGYDPSQYEEQQFTDGEQFNAITEQKEDDRIVSNVSLSNNKIMH